MKRILSAMLLLAVASVASAVPIGRTTIRHLLDQSPLVLKGTVVKISEAGTSEPTWTFNVPSVKTMRAEVESLYVLKGNAPTAPVEVLFPYVSSDSPLITLQQGSTYLLFLTTNGALIKVADPYNGAVPVLPGPKPEPAADPEALLKSEFESSLASSDSAVVLKALMALSEVGDKSSLEKVNRLTNSTNEPVRVAACAVALALGNWNKAAEVVRFIERHSQPSGEVVLSEAEKGIDVGVLTRILGHTAAPEAESMYLDLLGEARNPYVLKELLAAPCVASNKTAAPVVSQFLDNANDDVAYAAYRALMSMKGSNYKAQHLFLSEKASISVELKSWSASQGKSHGTKP